MKWSIGTVRSIGYEVCNSIYMHLAERMLEKQSKVKKEFVVTFAVWYSPLESVYLQPAIQNCGEME